LADPGPFPPPSMADVMSAVRVRLVGETCEADVFADPRAPRRELSTYMAVKGKYALPTQSWSLRGSGDWPSCISCRPSLKTCSI
jgi:hypothetical protein